MKPFLIAAGILASCLAGASAQSLDALNIQLHGYATQGFIYSDHNSWNETSSENGSASWTEAVVNLSAQPDPRLRISVQTRYFLLGSINNQIMLDYAQADYKFNDSFGFRVGKVKTPIGLLNESQDIDPSQLWVLLPQSIYPIASRDTILAHYGGLVYGTRTLGERVGKIEYRAFAGQRVVGADDGYFQTLRDAGITLPNGITGHTEGGMLRYLPPVHGLLFGASENSGVPSGEVAYGPYSGTIGLQRFRQTNYFTRYERSRFLLAAEYSRFMALTGVDVPGLLQATFQTDQRPWYVMATAKITGKLSAGLYYSSMMDYRAAVSNSRFQKDWTLAGRYDFNPFLYAKAEQHWIDGTAIGFATTDNPTLQPATRMTMLKLGVSF